MRANAEKMLNTFVNFALSMWPMMMRTDIQNI